MAKNAGWPTDQMPDQPASRPTDSTTIVYTAASATEYIWYAGIAPAAMNTMSTAPAAGPRAALARTERLKTMEATPQTRWKVRVPNRPWGRISSTSTVNENTNVSRKLAET
ncbi:hypothetical protein GCM10011578_075080 [Streptomyces fuscichromogenes]|uniref:Uncharacterized protein n=1 Tax=Streptomyces fuscichromogenes TaxID=1324013 RepID=A0A917XKS7_9ACTN|nr:hypothetical protein GCM10011578_075080 [Streptomyces fuscichromogenes]